jgi:hypothetical protein
MCLNVGGFEIFLSACARQELACPGNIVGQHPVIVGYFYGVRRVLSSALADPAHAGHRALPELRTLQ